MKRICLVITVFLCANTVLGQKKITQLWESKHLPTPESVLYVEGSKLLYVSLIDGGGMEKDGKGGIALLNLDGSIKDLDWVTGMDAPKGLALYQDLLYVADINSVSVIDVITGNEIRRIDVPGSTMLNDVTVDDNGVVYVSDTRANKIFEIRNNIPSLFLDKTESVNGLRFHKGNLYALVGPELWKIDSNKRVNVIAKGFALPGDGLEPVGKDDFLVTCWGGLVYYVYANGQFDLLLDERGKMNTADLGFNPKTNTLYIPTFNNNNVRAYQLQ